MTPKVADVLLEARRKVYELVANEFCMADVHALHALSALLVMDDQRGNETVIDLTDDDTESHDHLRSELRRVEAERQKDSAIITGLLARIAKLEGKA